MGLLSRFPWMNKHAWWYATQRLDFGFFLPAIARLPLAWGHRMAQWRGRFNARFARDWAEMSVGHAYIADRCAASFRSMYPGISEAEVRALVVQRYQTVSREELDAMRAILGRAQRLDVDLTPTKATLAKRTPGRGLVVTMGHFDSVFLGLIAMARCGECVNLMTSDIVVDERVHPAIRHYFRSKYKRYEDYMGGGRLLPTSSSTRQYFHNALGRGEVVVVATETPASPQAHKGTWVSWFGKRRKMADSAVRMAIDTNSEIMAMSSKEVAPGQYEWAASELVRPWTANIPEAAALREWVYAPLAAFMESAIRAEPGRWWASHLLHEFVVDIQTASLPTDTPADPGPSS